MQSSNWQVYFLNFNSHTSTQMKFDVGTGLNELHDSSSILNRFVWIEA